MLNALKPQDVRSTSGITPAIPPPTAQKALMILATLCSMPYCLSKPGDPVTSEPHAFRRRQPLPVVDELAHHPLWIVAPNELCLSPVGHVGGGIEFEPNDKLELQPRPRFGTVQRLLSHGGGSGARGIDAPRRSAILGRIHC